MRSPVELSPTGVPVKVLDAKMHQVLGRHEVSGTDAMRASSGLESVHVRTLRDVLVLGRERISQIRNIGVTTLQAIDVSVAAELDGVYSWQEKPAIDEIEPLCKDLRHLPGSLVIARGLEYHRRRPYPGLVVASRMSIDAMLKADPHELAEQLKEVEMSQGHEVMHEPLPRHEHTARTFKSEAAFIADTFWLARDTRLGSSA